MSRQIVVNGEEDKSFELVELHEALEYAGKCSIEKETPIDVMLPECDIILNRSLTIQGAIVLNGENNTTILMEGCGTFKVIGDLKFNKVSFRKLGEYFIPAFKVAGLLDISNSTLVNTTFLTVGGGNLSIDKANIIQDETPSKSVYLFAMRLFSSGVHQINETQITGFTAGIMVMAADETIGTLKMKDAGVECNEFALLVSEGDVSLENTKMSSETGLCVKIEGKIANISTKNCELGQFTIGSNRAHSQKTYGGKHIVINRLKTALNLFKNNNRKTALHVEHLMFFIRHCLDILPTLKGEIINAEMQLPNEMGIFAASYKINRDTDDESTLVTKDELMNHWRNHQDIKNFDEVLLFLDRLFNRMVIDDEEFDEWTKPLEELRKTKFQLLSYEQKKVYLIEKAKVDPLRTWYLLNKEVGDENDANGKRLRFEVLYFFATANRNLNMKNIRGFCVSWIGQWACEVLGKTFQEERIPDNADLREAWANYLMDKGKAQQILDWYQNLEFMQLPRHDALDRRIQFEAAHHVQNGINLKRTLRRRAVNERVLMQQHPEAMISDSQVFLGSGALPGYTRRIAEMATSIEEILVALKPAYENNATSKDFRERFCIATIDHHLMNVPQFQPQIKVSEDGGYETCPICFSQKLQPWNQMKLEGCKFGHAFCMDCFRNSMSTGSPELWGRCPGKSDGGNACIAVANRREMEMTGMPIDKIFNILRVRVTRALNDIPGWRNCNFCQIGGVRNNKNKYFTCPLCDSTVTETGDENDRAVKLRLLDGLEEHAIRRGKGVFRECYHCAAPYEKGDACSTITCTNCGKQYNMTWGNKNINHAYENDGVKAQRYVPKRPGHLWELGVFKDRKGKKLILGQELNDRQQQEVLKRARIAKRKLENA